MSPPPLTLRSPLPNFKQQFFGSLNFDSFTSLCLSLDMIRLYVTTTRAATTAITAAAEPARAKITNELGRHDG